MNWSKILKALREKMLLSQAELADILNVSFASVNRWENGRNEPTFKAKREINALCLKYNIDINSNEFKTEEL